MLTLITGTPGAGKTAWTVQELTRLPLQRKIFIHGVPELKIAHEPIYCTSELCDHCREITHYVDYSESLDDKGNVIKARTTIEAINKPGEPVYLVEEWPYWATEGSLIVVDEVQRIWRPLGSKVPNEVAALETHRHKGLDFWLISQGPHLFHANIRLLIGRHIHLVSSWRGRAEYEFPECRQNVSSRGDAIVRPYTLPKKIFHLYKSSSLHVKTHHRKPLSYYALIATICLACVLGFYAYQRFTNKVHSSTLTTEGGEARAQAVAPTPPGVISAENNKKMFPDFKPTIEGVPASAPAYADLVKVVAVPQIIGCVKTPKECKCYGKQAVPYEVSALFCEEYMKGHYFNPFKVPHHLKETANIEMAKTDVIESNEKK